MRQLFPENRHELLDRIGDFDGVASRLPLDCQNDGSLDAIRVVLPACVLIVLDTVDDIAEFFEVNRRPVALHDNHLSKRSGARQLSIRAERQRTLRAVHGACGNVHIPVAQCGLDFIQADLLGRQFRGIQMHADRIFLLAIDLDLRDAGNRRDALRKSRFRIFVQRPWRNGARHERQEQEWLVGWINLAEIRRTRHPRRQQRRRLRDRRLNIQRGAVQVTAQVELQRDLCTSNRVCRGHRVQSRNRRELAFERRRDGGRHRVRICSRQACGNQQCGKIDVGQIADSERAVGDRSKECDRQHQQAGGDRFSNENIRYVHSGPPMLLRWRSGFHLNPASGNKP